jgi:integrase/recombinase XerD
MYLQPQTQTPSLMPYVSTKEILTLDTLDEILKAFLASRDVKENSRNLYKKTLRIYFDWLMKKGYSLDEVHRAHIIEYKDELLKTKGSSLTVGSYLTAVRLFYEWAEAYKLYPNVAKSIKTPKRQQKYRKQPLTPEQVNILLKHTETLSKRDRALIILLLTTGLRTIEVERALVEDLTFKGSKRVLLVHGKGRDEKDNFVILTEETAAPLDDYLKSRSVQMFNSKSVLKPFEPLFSSNSNNSSGKAISTHTISQIVKTALQSIGLNAKEYSAHSLRHTAGTNILRAGGSLQQAQFTLRHSNPATTQIYTATFEEEGRLKDSGEVMLSNLYFGKSKTQTQKLLERLSDIAKTGSQGSTEALSADILNAVNNMIEQLNTFYKPTIISKI